MIKACIFDLDGTLLDTISTITYYVNLTLVGEGVEPITEQECKIFVGDGARLLIRRALASRGITDTDYAERVLRKYSAAYDSDPYHLTRVYPGITETVTELRRAGIRLGVLSNKPHSATVQVIESFFDGEFDFVLGAREGVPLKPEPTAALSLAGEMGASPTEVAFIGDTSVDILTAKNMGAALAVGVLWGFRTEDELAAAGADRVISEPAELISEVLQ